MGYFAHKALIVTSGYHHEELEKLHEMAKELELPVTEIVEGRANGFKSFAVLPDGSKEGWDESDRVDEGRASLIGNMLGTRLNYIEVRFGGDDNNAFILHHNGEE